MTITLDTDFDHLAYSPICLFCAHLSDVADRRCAAFPTGDGIPYVIWDGENDHTKPFRGDNGIQFERGTPIAIANAAERKD